LTEGHDQDSIQGMGAKEETKYARQLFLHGDGKNPPIKNPSLLSKASGVPLRTLRDHLKNWRVESEELVLRSPTSPYSLQLSDDVLTQHRKEIEFLARQVKKLRVRLSKLSTGTSQYHVVLGSYQSALTKWEKSSGILAHYETATAAMKEGARAKARLEAKQGDDSPKDKTPRGVSADRFDVEG